MLIAQLNPGSTVSMPGGGYTTNNDTYVVVESDTDKVSSHYDLFYVKKGADYPLEKITPSPEGVKFETLPIVGVGTFRDLCLSDII